MTLVDTSAWIDHLQRSNPVLVRLLAGESVYSHPFVIGELACGAFRHREQVLESLAQYPRIVEVDHDFVMTMVEGQRLMGLGIGWIDAHLLASCVATGCALLTFDRALRSAAGKVGVDLEN